MAKVTDLYGITDQEEAELDKGLAETKKNAYTKKPSFDWGKGVLGALKGVGGALLAVPTGGASLGLAASGVGDIVDAAGKEDTVNYMTGENIEGVTPDTMGKGLGDIGSQLTMKNTGGMSMLDQLLAATKGMPNQK